VVTLLTALILAPLVLLTSCLGIELFLGLRPLCQLAPAATVGADAVIVVPAHNEEAIIGEGLLALKAAAGDRARILVIADNCIDGTADVARSLGVEVAERIDAQRRGKGFALDFARTRLNQNPPEVVIVLDADCAMDADSIDKLVAWCAATGRPCQAVDLQRPATHASPTVQLSTFAFYIKNVVRQRALQRITGHAHLLGTGMALPWPMFERVTLATDNIVEDLLMGVELAQAGHPPLFVESASVWSNSETEKSTFAQRRRWEGGFLQNAVKSAPEAFRRNIKAGDLQGLWAAINLAIPPIALLVLLDLVALVLAGFLLWLTGADEWPLGLLAAPMFLALVALTLAWWTGGRRFVTLRAVAQIPLYLMWKLPLYLGLARRGAPKEWLRTRGS
jgi:cellulose synthase/poly-beta-1,6-N-acetylglucosamine synthase-like glycosyltransferase